MTETVRVQDLTKEYGQGDVITRALRGVDLGIAPGEFTAMAGPSGSGKSTLLNIIGGLDRPTSGTVRLEGRDIGTLSGRQLSHLRRDRIGFIFQSFNLIQGLTVLENIEVPESWSQVASDVLAQKYFRKAGVPARLKKVKEKGVPGWLSRSVADEKALAEPASAGVAQAGGGRQRIREPCPGACRGVIPRR